VTVEENPVQKDTEFMSRDLSAVKIAVTVEREIHSSVLLFLLRVADLRLSSIIINESPPRATCQNLLPCNGVRRPQTWGLAGVHFEPIQHIDRLRPGLK
jgi:hypothetical protein